MERQVGLVRGTRWPNGIKCGPHGARRARRCPGSSVAPQSRARRFVGLPSKPTWSRCKVAANNRSLYAGFVDLTTKSTSSRDDRGGQVKRKIGVEVAHSPRGLLIWPQNQHRAGAMVAAESRNEARPSRPSGAPEVKGLACSKLGVVRLCLVRGV